jgi:hypothetical protein
MITALPTAPDSQEAVHSASEVEDYDRWLKQGQLLESMQRYPKRWRPTVALSICDPSDPDLWLRQGNIALPAGAL